MSLKKDFKLPDKELFGLIPESYLLLSTEFTIIATTNCLLKTLELTEEKLLGLFVYDLFDELPESIETFLLTEDQSFDIVSRIGKTSFHLTFIPVLEGDKLSQVFCKIVKITGTNETKFGLLRNIANSFPGIIALYNIHSGEYLYVNKSIEAIIGYKSEELLSKGLPFITSLIHPDDIDQLTAKNTKALKRANNEYADYDDDKIISFEYRIKSKSGEYKWLRTYGVVYQRTKDHLVELILNISLDITERKKKELETQQSEKRLAQHSSTLEEKLKKEKEELEKKESYFHFMSDAIPGIVWTSLPNGENDYYSRRWEEYTGISAEAAIKGDWTDTLHPDDLESTFAAMEKSMETGDEYKAEHRLKAKDGTYRWFLARARPSKDKNGNIIKWFGTSFDIDDEKRLLEELKESRSRYKFLADSIPQLVYTANPDGSIDYLNKRWYEYTGIRQDDLEQALIENTIHPDDATTLEESFAHSMKTGEPLNAEFRLRKHNGEYRWFLGRAIPMRDEKGNIIKWFGSSTDIQVQKEIIEHLADAEKRLSKINNELSRKNDELRKINNDLDNFIYTASHDLKAPISNIEGLINFLKSDDYYKNPEIKEVMDLMEKSTERFKNTIEGLTDVAKIQKTFNEDIEEINIEKLLTEVIQDISGFEESNAQITTDLQVPTVKFTIKNLRSILYNLIGNSIKYKSPRRDPVIHIATKELDGYTIISVEDNGIGIEKENQRKVFKMFKRLHNEIEGTGIGLYIAKRIMDNADGKIEIESKPGEGTKFILYFKK